MNKQNIIVSACRFVRESKENYIAKEIAISPDLVGMKIYEDPIFAFASATDEGFLKLKDPVAIGEHFKLPEQWLPEAKTVVSFFLPFSEVIKESNAIDLSWPSDEWLHGRIEGQAFLNQLMQYIKGELIQSGYESVVPTMEQGFWTQSIAQDGSLHPEVSFTSNWSERHVAFVCGLGTFGLSKGLITPKGICGRFGSVVTSLSLEPDPKEYERVYEYCSVCGVCAENCPVDAISIENGKDHITCLRFVDETLEKHAPRYGCGKCQVGVPCESGIPIRRPSER